MKKTIALFLYDPKCSIQSGNGIIKALQNNYNFKIFGINELEDGFFDDVDIIAVPGGFGDADSFNQAFKYNSNRIKQFIADGGYYLGVCMGAYWAGQHYFDILDGVDAVQYITRPNTDTRRPHAKNIKIEWLGEPMTMFWYDGCAFTGAGCYDTVAKYANNDPMAIIQNRIGLIGAHPESEQFWYDGYSWMQGKYHLGRHHELLLNFVQLLTKQ